METYSYGIFIDLIAGIPEAKTFIEDWRKHIDPEDWEEIRLLPLTLFRVMELINDATFHFQGRMVGVNNPRAEEEFQRLLQEIQEKASEFGVEVNPAKIRPATLITAAMAMAD